MHNIAIFCLFAFIFAFCAGACPDGTIASFTNSNNCYFFSANQSTFIIAEGICRQHGGHLASVLNAFDNMFLNQEASFIFSDGTDLNFWIGAQTELIPGTWSWMDGELFNYTDWDKGQPQNTSLSNCAFSSIASSLWSADDCFQNKSFVCLIPAPTTTTSTTTTTTTAMPTTTTKKVPSCERGWTTFDQTGFCYKTFTNYNKTWEDAETYCSYYYQSHLVSIHSQLESDFVGDLARGALPNPSTVCGYEQCWIGLYTVTSNVEWQWNDGSPVNFYGWSPGEPNRPGTENCVQIMLIPCNGDNANYWNNMQCNEASQNFVCKKAKS